MKPLHTLAFAATLAVAAAGGVLADTTTLFGAPGWSPARSTATPPRSGRAARATARTTWTSRAAATAPSTSPSASLTSTAAAFHWPPTPT